VAVNGTQKTTNSKSAAAKLMISTLVVERIVGLAATTGAGMKIDKKKIKNWCVRMSQTKKKKTPTNLGWMACSFQSDWQK
jgi:hypothetical protein